MRIQRHCRVELEYRLSGSDGEVYDSSGDSGPLTYVHGRGELPPKLESALEGAEAGAEVALTLEPRDAFGEYDPAGIVSVPPGDLPPGEALAVGTVVPVSIEDDEGASEEVEMRIVDVQPDAVYLDMNPVLAGKTVTFELRVLAVAPAEGQA